MLKIRNTTILIFTALVAITSVSANKANQRWISLDSFPEGSNPSISVNVSNDKHSIIDLDIHGFYISDISLNNIKYQFISIPGYNHSTEIGAPCVPQIPVRIGVPDTASTTFREITRNTRTFENITVYPSQQPQTDEILMDEFAINRLIYKSDQSYPIIPGVISNPMIWRDIRLVTATIFPVQTNCATSTLSVATHIQFEVIYLDDSTTNTKHRKDFSVSPQYDRMYRSAIVNYDHLDFYPKTHRSFDVNYLMIADDPLIGAIEPLAQWHTQSGNLTVIRPVSEVGNTYDAIKSEIQGYYQSDQIEYVLFVGELPQIPMHYFSHYGMEGVGDYDYSCLEGNDWYPEVAIGRILSDQSELTNHISTRILNYMLTPPSDNWFERNILCAHEEEYPFKYTECKNQIKEYPYFVQTPVFETCYPPEGATREQLVSAIENGCGIVNYRGHGGPQEWCWSIGWSNSDVYALNNNNYTPIIWNIACFNAQIDMADESLSEAWQNAGANGNGGAVANVGATRASFTTVNNTFDIELYKSIFDVGSTILGNVVNYGKSAMVSDSIYGEFNARIYILLGDPAMDITTHTPELMDCSYPQIIQSGSSEIEIIVTHGQTPLEGARVCLHKDQDCHEIGITNSSGVALIPVTISSEEGSIKLTVTSHNYTSYSAEILIDNGGCGSIQLDQDIYGCTQSIQVNVFDTDLNIDPDTQEQTLVDITSDTEPSGRTILLTETGNDTGEFQGSIQASPTQSGQGYILVSDNDIVTAIYLDADCVGDPQTIKTSAVIDCIGPALSTPEITDLSWDSVSINWISDEAADSKVSWGITIPPQNETGNPEYTSVHRIDLTGLSDGTMYYYSISSTDIYENNTTDDNGGAYYSFTTLPCSSPTQQPTASATPATCTATPTSLFTSTPAPGTPNPTFTAMYPTATPQYQATNTPNDTPPPGTSTPTHPQAPTATPTMSTPPTCTPLISTTTPTAAPNSTWTPVPTNAPYATHTRPPFPTTTPSPAQTASPYKGLKLYLIDRDLDADDEFNLYFVLFNPEHSSYECDVYLLLSAFESYWCWPSWRDHTSGLDYQTFDVPAKNLVKEDVLRFSWPEGVGEGYGLSFIGCAFKPRRWEIIGELQTIEWQYH